MGVVPDLVTASVGYNQNLQVMSGHFTVFRVEICSPKPFAPRVLFKRHFAEVKILLNKIQSE